MQLKPILPVIDGPCPVHVLTILMDNPDMFKHRLPNMFTVMNGIIILLGGFNHLQNMSSSMGRIILYIMEN
jgi:hypothetical protein